VDFCHQFFVFIKLAQINTMGMPMSTKKTPIHWRPFHALVSPRKKTRTANVNNMVTGSLRFKSHKYKKEPRRANNKYAITTGDIRALFNILGLTGAFTQAAPKVTTANTPTIHIDCASWKARGSRFLEPTFSKTDAPDNNMTFLKTRSSFQA